jgi:hypothetical protein
MYEDGGVDADALSPVAEELDSEHVDHEELAEPIGVVLCPW